MSWTSDNKVNGYCFNDGKDNVIRFIAYNNTLDLVESIRSRMKRKSFQITVSSFYLVVS